MAQVLGKRPQGQLGDPTQGELPDPAMSPPLLEPNQATKQTQ